MPSRNPNSGNGIPTFQIGYSLHCGYHNIPAKSYRHPKRFPEERLKG